MHTILSVLGRCHVLCTAPPTSRMRTAPTDLHPSCSTLCVRTLSVIRSRVPVVHAWAGTAEHVRRLGRDLHMHGPRFCFHANPNIWGLCTSLHGTSQWSPLARVHWHHVPDLVRASMSRMLFQPCRPRTCRLPDTDARQLHCRSSAVSRPVAALIIFLCMCALRACVHACVL